MQNGIALLILENTGKIFIRHLKNFPWAKKPQVTDKVALDLNGTSSASLTGTYEITLKVDPDTDTVEVQLFLKKINEATPSNLLWSHRPYIMVT